MRSVASIERSRVWRARKSASDVHVCLACGGPIEDCLARAGSLRCHDCRDGDAPLTAGLVERRPRRAVPWTATRKAA
jgi:hypothetical protein